jgi:benzodiazapine receptor
MKKINWKYISIAVISVVLVAAIGSIFTSAGVASSWYESAKPSITPPNWIFPVVWNILFVLIIISFYMSLSCSKNAGARKRIYFAFYLNFILNILWSFLYFTLRNPAAAFIDIIPLWFSIWLMIFAARKAGKIAAWLLVPYLAWVAFAAVLNFMSI